MNAPLLNRTTTNRRDARWVCGLTVLGIAILYLSQWLQMPLYQDEVALRVLRARFLVDGATGAYLFGSQRLCYLRPGTDYSGVSGFYQLGYSNSNTSLARYYWGAGLTGFGLVPYRPNDSLGGGLFAMPVAL